MPDTPDDEPLMHSPIIAEAEDTDDADTGFNSRIKARVANSIGRTPFGRALGIEALAVSRGHIKAKIPYDEHLIGDLDTGIIHGGVITSLLDHICGMAVATSLRKAKVPATLDLRIDYMKAAKPQMEVIGEALCYHVTRHVAFARAWAYHETREQPIATATGAFMLNEISIGRNRT